MKCENNSPLISSRDSRSLSYNGGYASPTPISGSLHAIGECAVAPMPLATADRLMGGSEGSDRSISSTNSIKQMMRKSALHKKRSNTDSEEKDCQVLTSGER